MKDDQKGACFVLSWCVSLIYFYIPLVLSSSLISVPKEKENKVQQRNTDKDCPLAKGEYNAIRI